jgi:hypothetical protein
MIFTYKLQLLQYEQTRRICQCFGISRAVLVGAVDLWYTVLSQRGAGRQTAQTWPTRKEPASGRDTRNGRDVCALRHYLDGTASLTVSQSSVVGRVPEASYWLHLLPFAPQSGLVPPRNLSARPYCRNGLGTGNDGARSNPCTTTHQASAC